MKFYCINWFNEDVDPSRRWFKNFQDELTKIGHSVKIIRLERRGDKPNIFARRLVMLVRLVKAIIESKKEKSFLVMQYPYCFSFVVPFLGKYMLDTTDTQHIRELVLMNGTPWYKRIIFHMHYWSWRIWLKFSTCVRCNSHYVYNMAESKSIVLYDHLLDGFDTEIVYNSRPIIGFLCSSGTEQWLDEYLPVLKYFQNNGVDFEFMGGSEEYAKKSGAKHLPWTDYNLRNIMHRWACGLALLPKGDMPGKQQGKIFQYMASGIPVIATPQGETKYILGDDYPFIVTNNEELKNTINKIISNPEYSKKIGVEGITRVNQWNMKNQVTRFLTWVDELGLSK